MIIGLTGPAAAGKNEVAKICRRRGALVIDADKVAHALYATQSLAWHELVRHFGSRILMRGGKVDRKKLGEIVFADRPKLQLLNKIVHPHLKEKIVQLLDGAKVTVINAAVLKEIGLLPLVDKVWVVMAPRATRLKRLLKRGLSKAEANRLLNSQMSQAAYINMADLVINNNGTLKQLAAQVRKNLA